MEKIFVPLYRFFNKHKGLLYSLLAVSTIFFAWSGFKLQFEEDIFKLLPKTDASAKNSIAFEDIEVKDKIFIEIFSPEGLSPDKLIEVQDAFVEKMTSRDSSCGYIKDFLYALDADDGMNALYYALDHLPSYLPEGFYNIMDKALAEDLDIPSVLPSLLPSLQTGRTFIDGHLFSADSTLALVYLSPSFSATDSRTASALVRNMDEVRESLSEEYPSVEVLYHGTVVDGAFNSRQIKKDLVVSVGISLFLILLVICVCFKKKNTLPLLLSPVVYGLLSALSAVYFIQGKMSLIAIGIGAMILGAALSYCLHVLVHHKYVENVEQLLRDQSTPVCLGCITTVGAFVGLIFTSSDLLRDFGIFASFALLGTTFFALVFLPHFMNGGKEEKNETAFHIIRIINSYPLHKKKVWVSALGAVCIASLFLAGKVGFDSDLNHIGYVEKRVEQSSRLYTQKVDGGDRCVYYAAFAGSLDEAILTGRRIDSCLDSLKGAGLLSSFTSASPLLVPLEEQQENIDRWKSYWTPEKVERACGILGAYARKYGWDVPFDIPATFRMEAEMDFFPEQITDTDMLPWNLLCNYVEKRDDGFLIYTSALVPEENVTAVGEKVDSIDGALVLDPYFYTGDMVKIIHGDFLVVLAISSLFVLLILLLSFRSITTALFAFLPMFFSWNIVQAVMVLCGVDFNLLSVMISSFIFGIGVDYSIFMTEGLLSKAKIGKNELLDYHKSAILISIFVLMVVIASLLLARHPAMRSVGFATVIGMGATVLITYTLQPFLFKILVKSAFLRRRMLHEK